MEVLGPKQAIRCSSQVLGEEVGVALFAMPKGGFLRRVAVHSVASVAGGAAANAVISAASRGAAEMVQEKPPKHLLIALTRSGLALLEVRLSLLGAVKPVGVWRELQKGSYSVTTGSGMATQRFDINSGGDVIHLETKVMGSNRPNMAALDAIVRASVADAKGAAGGSSSAAE